MAATASSTEGPAAISAQQQQGIVAFGLSSDGLSLFATRALRLFSYGAIAPVFFLFCVEIGLSEWDVGFLLTLILVGDLFVTLYLSTSADAFGRRRILVIGSCLKVLGGLAFAFTRSYPLLVLAGIVGVISTSGGECGPFINVEQAALTDAVLVSGGNASGNSGAAKVAVLFGYYNALGFTAQALGSLSSGLAVKYLPVPPLVAHRIIFLSYGAVGTLMALIYSRLSPSVECATAVAAAVARGPTSSGGWWLPRVSLGLRRPESKYIVARLSALFAVDAFGGAFVMQSFVAFWFHERWAFSPDLIGYLLMASSIMAGASGIVAALLVNRFGAMLTMIATHLPSNVLLVFVPLMPSRASAAAMLVARASISSMDVPARQAYVTMVVASDERSAAGGITNIVRSLGMSVAPILLGYFSSAHPRSGWLFAAPWLVAGGVKIFYDVTLYALYLSDSRLNKAEEEQRGREAAESVAAREAEAAASAEEGAPAAEAEAEAEARLVGAIPSAIIVDERSPPPPQGAGLAAAADPLPPLVFASTSAKRRKDKAAGRKEAKADVGLEQPLLAARRDDEEEDADEN